ncbi:MAG: GNAT family N-acetyltransferase [Candidatus Eremiobacteraeota bacterium]|nr:GNAT family N-acetyltransferase [Candidatus Eremiobacteraeota bacterium]
MPVEIVRTKPGAAGEFLQTGQREALRELYGFSVVWHEQQHEFAAIDDGAIVGAATIRIAASLAHIEALAVSPERRLAGIGRRLLDQAAEVANYYNCHKMTVQVPNRSGAQKFFERCDYREEAVLAQHTFKLDVAVLRKFLL